MSTTHSKLTFVGGPLDGRVVPNVGGYFKDGDFETVETRIADGDYGPESCYRVVGDKLIYDADLTKRRRDYIRKHPKNNGGAV